MDTARRELARLRASADAWQDVRFEPVPAGDGQTRDANEVRRAQVLWALQYDHGPRDLELVRWLVAQEACKCAQVQGHGLGEVAELAGYLLARYRQVADVWLHYRLKTANFDCWCGYDLAYLCAAGIQETVAYVRGSGHRARDEVLATLLEEDKTDEEVAGWLDQDDRFPPEETREDPLTWVERAQLLGDTALARTWLDRWADGRDRDADTLTTLRYQLADLGAYAEAAEIQRQRMPPPGDAWTAASAWWDLANLERQAGHHRAAWDALRDCGRALAEVRNGFHTGLGRMYGEELYLLATEAEPALAEEVYAEAERQAGLLPDRPRAAAAAAARLGKS